MARAYICSPYRGDVTRNTAYARELTRAAALQGYAPITPHLYLTQALDDENDIERMLGLTAGIELLKVCDVVIVGARYGVSEGMWEELQVALSAKIPIKVL